MVLAGAFSGGGVAAVAAYASRHKTNSETGHLDAQTSALMSTAARDWIASQNVHVAELTASIADLRTRLTIAETAAAAAHTAALAAVEREARCTAAVAEMQKQIDVLRQQVEHPPTVTTVTTAVTTQEPKP